MQNFLNPQQIQSFITDGFIRIDNAFSADLAREARSILWKDIPADPSDRSTWTQPVVWLGMYTQEPFIKAANTAILHQAFDQLVGKGKWLPCMSMGAFPIRFPSEVDSGDTGWHVDASFPGDDPHDFFSARVNVYSKGRGLLMLFLFSDVSERDAPTRILKGSHLDVARLLEPEGEKGFSFMELTGKLSELPAREEALAIGKAGTVYLCHPFLVHAAQRHRGLVPKFMAQPPLLLKSDFNISSTSACSPVEEAIRIALGR
ncbi:phytanoyl-CoA dioxygenase family protein [Olivibacter sp. LS-1]|uniref:phytanoyl-CoA dioxygenase family protein n=1 Tax=unclassified Olivibacter TaxID=2632301 RepID=UPI0011EB07EC|nr:MULTISPECIES: phytanoyl-CoA dioxygenase family protein [unclassified Olivibacter]MDM8177233.1 phytanoyl-CoA dioxygenase family protein [Olivibacter sp. 47]QEL00387.1 phytanoyl-CoA dioxygenase family protein [Olivibacter sp. LS-1]